MKTSRFRVLHVGKFYAPYRGGMETHLELICEGLRRSCDVSVIVASENRRTAYDRVGDLDVTRVGAVAQLAGTAITPGMVSAIRSRPAEIIHVHWPNPMAVAAYFASGHTGRLVITYHSDVVRQRVLAKAFWPVLNAAFKRADAV